jgi:hypothetical protein
MATDTAVPPGPSSFETRGAQPRAPQDEEKSYFSTERASFLKSAMAW